VVCEQLPRKSESPKNCQLGIASLKSSAELPKCDHPILLPCELDPVAREKRFGPFEHAETVAGTVSK
jgi:hypothetical protein